MRLQIDAVGSSHFVTVIVSVGGDLQIPHLHIVAVDQIHPAQLARGINHGQFAFTITVNGDLTDEPDETFFVNLSNPVNATIDAETGQGTILNDDEPPSMTIYDTSIAEGDAGIVNANFTVTLTALSGHVVSANYISADGTAESGIDYLSLLSASVSACGVRRWIRRISWFETATFVEPGPKRSR